MNFINKIELSNCPFYENCNASIGPLDENKKKQFGIQMRLYVKILSIQA